MTRSVDLDAQEELCVRGGRGLVDGVYGSERLREELGVCESEGVVLRVACDTEARLYRGRRGRDVVSEYDVPVRNCRRYFDASDSTLAFSSFDMALPSDDGSGKTKDERLVVGVVGERAGTMSGNSISSMGALKAVIGGE
jgi:hypothetical protein